jgi:hypothetical protein
MISAIKNNDNKIGYISQTLNPVFFTKILDFLNIKENLFYIRNADSDIVLDNYASYQFINNRKSSFSYMLYDKLTSSKEENLTISIDNVDYSLGVIVENNNAAGAAFSFLGLMLIVYLAIVLANVIWSNSATLLDDIKVKIFRSRKSLHSQGSVKPTISSKIQAEIDKELDKLKNRSIKTIKNEFYADSFISK